MEHHRANSTATHFSCPSCHRRYGLKVKVLPFFCPCGARLDEITYLAANPYERPLPIARPTQDLPCHHRGETLREINCGCSGKPKIYACNLHGECYLRKLPKMPRSEIEGKQMCLDCDDRRQFAIGDVGVLACVFNRIGGTETYWQSIHKHLGLSGLVTPQAPKHSHAAFTLGHGEDAIRELCDSVKNLIVWGVTSLGEITQGPNRIAIHHGSLQSTWANAVFENQLKWCEDAVAINEDVAVHYGCHYVANAIEPDRIAGQARMKQKKVVLWLHREAQEKRPWLVRRIAEVLPDDYVIVASLPRERSGDKLHCIGQVDHPGDWLATADVFLSTADQEGFGYSVAEAMAAGVPVVSSPFGIAADPQLVEQVHSEDPQAWVDAILRAGPKAAAAKQYIDEHHSAEAWAAAWQNLLRA